MNLEPLQTGEEIPMGKRNGDLTAAAGAFTQVTGVLGGFAITMIVLLLSNNSAQSDVLYDGIIALLLAAAFIYIMASGVFANATSYDDPAVVDAVYNAAVRYFHIANLVPVISLFLLVARTAGILSILVGLLILLRTIQVAVVNLFPR